MSEPPMVANRFPSLDGVRGFAALLVVFWHYIPSSTRTDPGTVLGYLAKAGGLCWSGVDLFFVLSGFLIGRILIRERASANLMRAFYARRACRIFPLYFFMISVVVLLRVALPPGETWERLVSNPFPVWAYPLFVQNILMTAVDHFGTPLLSASWSLAVEEQFYLIAPLLVALLPPRFLPWMLGLLFFGAALVRPWLTPLGSYTLLWARADCLAVGCLLAWWVENDRLEWLRRNKRFVAVIASVLLLACALYVLRGEGLKTVTQGRGRFHLTWIAAGYAFLLAVVLAWPAGFVAQAFDNSILRRAGVLSYGIYLVHGPILHAWFEITRASNPLFQHTRELWIMLPLLAAVWIVAELLHRFIEQPFLRLGHRVGYQR